MWRQDGGIWSGRDYLDQQDYFRSKENEFMERKFQEKENNQLKQDSSNQEIKNDNE